MTEASGVAGSRPRHALSLAVPAVLGGGALVLVAVVLLVTSNDQPTATPSATPTANTVGPGRVDTLLHTSDGTLGLSIGPNRSGAWNSLVLTIGTHGEPVRHAAVTVDFTMLDMSMGTLTFPLSEEHPGRYVYVGPATVMPGDWQLSFRVKLSSGRRLTASVRDHVN